jgi:hypothetical protein
MQQLSLINDNTYTFDIAWMTSSLASSRGETGNWQGRKLWSIHTDQPGEDLDFFFIAFSRYIA